MNSMYMSFYGFFFPINDFLKKFLYHGKFQTYKSKENSLLNAHSVQFSSVTQSCPTLGDPMNRSTPGLPVHHHLLEFTQTHVHWVSDAIQPSSSVVPFSSCPQSLPASSFPMSQLFARGGQSTGVSALASFLPKKYQVDLLQNGLVGSPCSPRNSQESSPTPQVIVNLYAQIQNLFFIYRGKLSYIKNLCLSKTSWLKEYWLHLH